MSTADYVVLAALAICAAAAIISIIRSKKHGGCCQGCNGCCADCTKYKKGKRSDDSINNNK